MANPNHKPWSKTDLKNLETIISQAPTVSKGIEVAAKKLGRSEGAVQNKYYALLRERSPEDAPPARSTGRPRSTAIKRRLPITMVVADMSARELVALASEVKAEIEKRKQELDDAFKLLS